MADRNRKMHDAKMTDDLENSIEYVQVYMKCIMERCIHGITDCHCFADNTLRFVIL